MYELTIDATFSAAHRLREYDGCCERLHGHNWRVQATVKTTTLNHIGIALDFKCLKTLLNRVLQQLDHTMLNEHPVFAVLNPTCENLAHWIYQELKQAVAELGVAVAKITVYESVDSSCCYYED